MSRAVLTPDPTAAAWTLLAGERERFDQGLLNALHPQQAYLTDVEYATYHRGKKLRPLLLLLAGRMCMRDHAAAVPEQMIQAAISLEMLHTATLIHDDIVDDATQRRGGPSVVAARGTKTAVLIGDMQFVQAIRVFAASVDTARDMQLVRMVLDVGFKLCAGELDEMQADPDLPAESLRTRYFRTIDRKTATLFGLACEVGANLGGAEDRVLYAASQFGWDIGRAFQIMDDVLDFVHPEALAGKSAHADLAARRMTLPILYALEEYGEQHILAAVVRGRASSPDDITAAAKAVIESNGLTRAYALARSYVIEGVRQLHVVPASAYRDAAEQIAFYIVNRNFLPASAPELPATPSELPAL
jgi:heptaprenyl diphosphate synthase